MRSALSLLKLIDEDRKSPDIHHHHYVDENSTDDAEEGTNICNSTFVEWIQKRSRFTIFALLLVAVLAFASLLSLLAWTYINKVYTSELPLVSHKPNQMNLFSHEEQEFHLPSEDREKETSTDASGDSYVDVISLPSQRHHDEPTFTIAKSSELSLDQSDGSEDVVSHNLFLDNSEDASLENNSPDEFRFEEHNTLAEGDRKKHISKHQHMGHSNFREENAATREKSVNIIEVKAVSVAADDEKKVHESPNNPEPSPSPEKNKPSSREHVDENAASRYVTTISEPPDPPAMTLYKVNNAVKAGAVCLDGSAPAYYHRPGSGNSEKLWIIHFNGGAWCFDKKACFERSHSSLGSTKKLPPSPPIIQGINSPDPSVNPDFYDWNLVWVVYCDGASFTGNRERPMISDSGETIYMRGKRVLNAIVNDLLYNRKFKFAEAIILTGSSAGSMTAIFQADYIASKFPKTIPVRILSDAGFFIDTAPLGGKNLGSMFKRIYEMQNSSAGLDQACVSDLGIENGWQCFLPSKTVKYVKTPMFVLNSAYDIWALIYFLDIDCKFPSGDRLQRRKRGVRQHTVVRSDSELEINEPRSQTFMFPSNTKLLAEFLGRKRRDISGFEIMPFFRQSVSQRKDDTPDIPKAMKKLTNLSAIKETDISPIFNVTSFNEHAQDNVLHNTSQTLHQSSNVNEYSNNSGIHRINVKDNKTVAEMLSNSMKELTGSSFSDNTLSHEPMSLLTRNKNRTKEIHSTDKQNRTSVHNLSLYGNISTERTTKSMIPVHKNSEPPRRNQFVSNSKKLQELGRRRNRSRMLSNIRNKQFYTMTGEKRGNINHFSKSSKELLKTRRSTSIAKEYINILRSDPPECTEKEILNAMKYRSAITRATDILMHTPKSGRFLVSCIDHSLSLFDETWTSLIVGGKSIQQAFGDWFYERGNKAKYNLVDCPYPCNPSCP